MDFDIIINGKYDIDNLQSRKKQKKRLIYYRRTIW